jgi:hypothetical protein
MAGKGKIVRGALEALTDAFKDKPVDKSRREFIKKAPVATAGGAGALAGLGTAAVIGAKALFSQGKFDDIIAKIKSSFDEDWHDISFHTNESPSGILQKSLGISDDEFVKISDDTQFIDQFEDVLSEMEGEVSVDKISSGIRDMVDNFMGEYSWDFHKGRGENPSVLIDEFKKPVFKLEVRKKFPDIDSAELDDLTEKLF